MENLKKALEEAIAGAVKEQSDSTNKSFVMLGKAQAFREVLASLEQMEQAQEIESAPDATKAPEA